MSVVSFVQKDTLPPPSEILPVLYKEPLQTLTSAASFSITKNGQTYTIKPLFNYELYGLVVSCHRSSSWEDYYHEQWKDWINVKDLCVIWGDNFKSGSYRKMTFQNGSWTCYYNLKPGEPLSEWTKFAAQCLSNNHLVVADERVSRSIMKVEKGDQVYFKGYLVNYGRGGNPDQRRSSTVRSDTGNGACEVVYVEDFKILKKANVEWKWLFHFSIFLVFTTLAGFLLLLGKKSKERQEE